LNLEIHIISGSFASVDIGHQNNDAFFDGRDRQLLLFTQSICFQTWRTKRPIMMTPLIEMKALRISRLINVMMNITIAEAANPYIPHRFHFQMAKTHTKFTRHKRAMGRRVHFG
jgi:hypothetical protein